MADDIPMQEDTRSPAPARVPDMGEYAINLQRMIEAHCRGELLMPALADKSPHLAENMTQEQMGRITFRIGPRDLYETKCEKCGKLAIYLLARPYDLAPGGEIASPSCAECAAGFPLWKAGGVGRAFDPAPLPATPAVRTSREDVERAMKEYGAAFLQYINVGGPKLRLRQAEDALLALVQPVPTEPCATGRILSEAESAEAEELYARLSRQADPYALTRTIEHFRPFCRSTPVQPVPDSAGEPK